MKEECSLGISDAAIIHIMKHMVLVRRLSCLLTNSLQSYSLMSQDRKWLGIISEADRTKPHIIQTVILWEPLMTTEVGFIWLSREKQRNQSNISKYIRPPPAKKKEPSFGMVFFVILFRMTESDPSEPGAFSLRKIYQTNDTWSSFVMTHKDTQGNTRTHKEGNVVTSLNLKRQLWSSTWSVNSHVSGCNSSRCQTKHLYEDWLSISSLLQLGLLSYGCIANILVCMFLEETNYCGKGRQSRMGLWHLHLAIKLSELLCLLQAATLLLNV